MTSQKERVLAGEPYIADDPELAADLRRAAELSGKFNDSPAGDVPARRAALAELLGELGEDTDVRPPLHVDYGCRISIGPRSFVNFGAVLLDVSEITIGADVQFGPYVQLLTPTHPVDPEERRAKWEAAQPITIGDNVWLGGGVIVCPGVTIGENTVVGAGAGRHPRPARERRRGRQPRTRRPRDLSPRTCRWAISRGIAHRPSERVRGLVGTFPGRL